MHYLTFIFKFTILKVKNITSGGNAVKRIEQVEKALAELSAGHGITAGNLAASLGLSRANVSSDLNRLCGEGKAEKYGSKPVYYKIPENSVQPSAELLLDEFVRNNRSLFHCVEQAKAAILYPPHGMHMLLFGETGVGKSMFAELIYNYARESGSLTGNAPFIAFNCADYADNPQLLVSQLMGTKKGAYTGADSDRPGLLEKADGGILFLDEVHRLPPQGQEMLFTFIDKGIYRRLGETEAERRASVLIICATTENPESNLLKTFVRRIPMIIKIPNLNTRSIDERLSLISGFFINESARLKKPILVSVNSVRSLLCYNCPNNIGQLKNDVQIICAKAYSDYVTGKKDCLRIVSRDLPDYIREGLYLETTHRQIWNRFVGISGRFCVFDSKEESASLRRDEVDESIYDIIDAHMEQLKSDGADDAKIADEIDGDIQNYFEKYTVLPDRPENFSSLRNLVGMDVVCTVDQILADVEEKLGRSYSNNVRYGLAVHIYSSIGRIRRGRRTVNPKLNEIRKELPGEFSAALEGLKIIDKKFNVEMPIDEAGFLAVFFDLNHLRHRTRVLVVVIAHGKTTATSMVDAANWLLGSKYALGINAPLDEKPQDVYLRLKELVKSQPENSGLLLLVDMGSLTNFSSDIQQELGIQTKVIPLVSTLHVLEAARKASLGYPLDYIYQETMHVGEQLFDMGLSTPVKKKLAKAFIVAICTTGEGSAVLLKDTLDRRLNYHDSFCETITLKLTDREAIEDRLCAIGQIGKVLCVVSTFQIDFPIPYFNLPDVLAGEAIPAIQKLIDGEAIFDKIAETFSTMLKNGDSEKIFHEVRSVVEAIEKRSGFKLNFDALVGVLCHMGCMVDRMLGKSSVVDFPNKKHFIGKNRYFFDIIADCCKILQEKFSIVIPDDEICYIITFFAPENRESKDSTLCMSAEAGTQNATNHGETHFN